MQKNDKFYTFLFKHSNKKGIYFKRFAVSKAKVHYGAVGLFFVLGLTGIGVGINGIVRHNVLANVVESAPASTQLAATQPQITQAIDYTRPQASEDLAFNSGGPESADEKGGDDSALEAQLEQIELIMPKENVPNMWAHVGKINNEFGFRRNPFGGRSYEFHNGMDIDGERGDSVFAPGAGVVIKAAWTGGYGNLIEIDHGNGITTRYGHLSKIDVAVGDTVTRAQLIGYVGSTGRSTGPHLHYELRLSDRAINPRHFLPQEPMEIALKSK